jgi:GAF domain-containing protein
MEKPQAEEARLKALKRYDILDTPADGSFDKLASLAARVFNMPIAIISLVDEDRIWFKAHHGIDVNQIGRDPGLCASAILSNDIYLVEDARNDPRTLANPLVAGDFGLRFYAAVPLTTHDGYNLGTFCIIDRKQRYLTNDQQLILKDMASVAMDEIELRRAARAATQASNERIAELEKQLS